ncbi:MAG: chromosome segregation ATPase [Psychroserpens sp.]
MSNRVEPEFPTIAIDQDQVKVARDPASKAHKTDNSRITANNKKLSTLAKTLFMLMSYVALAGSGWYFYQQQLNVEQLLESSSKRIQLLENQLSATGQEMGESTIALKVKLEFISEKTELLLSEMDKLESISEKTELLLSEIDKLWASAWRNNQKEIKELNSQSMKMTQQQDKSNDTLSDLKDKITATEFSINAISKQMIAISNLKDALKKLSSQVNTLDANAKSRDKQQMFTATTVNEFDTSLQLLVERMERLEAILASNTNLIK